MEQQTQTLIKLNSNNRIIYRMDNYLYQPYGNTILIKDGLYNIENISDEIDNTDCIIRTILVSYKNL